MTPIAAAVVAGVFGCAAAAISAALARVRRDLDACLRDRRQLKLSMQLIVGSLVGLLPDAKRDQLLVAVSAALESVDEAA